MLLISYPGFLGTLVIFYDNNLCIENLAFLKFAAFMYINMALLSLGRLNCILYPFFFLWKIVVKFFMAGTSLLFLISLFLLGGPDTWLKFFVIAQISCISLSGEYVGLTGARLDGAEMLACGLATHFVTSSVSNEDEKENDCTWLNCSSSICILLIHLEFTLPCFFSLVHYWV